MKQKPPKLPFEMPPQKAKLHHSEMILGEPNTSRNPKLLEKCQQAYEKMKADELKPGKEVDKLKKAKQSD